VIAVDTSVAVPALTSWHERHEVATRVLAGREAVLAAHAVLETYSVLTRLPDRRALHPADAEALIRARFPVPPLALPSRSYRRLLATLAEAGLGGGAVYDAVVGATAAHAGVPLVTLDRRALPVYRLVGAETQLLA
jgi:predicted nucleic acid-binding protein